MGAIISRFRKEKTTYEVLENLEEKIKDIEAYTISTQAQQKRFVGNFLVISIGLYILASLIFYFVFFPPTWNDRIIHSLPLLICPMLITLFKRILAWYFERKVISNTNELKELRAEKKRILEKVMDKETYKVAVDILNKFGDKSFKTQTQSLSALTPMKVPQPIAVTPKAPVQIRPVQSASVSGTPLRPMPMTPIGFNVNARPLTPTAMAALQRQQTGVIQRPMGMVPPSMQTVAYRRTPFPIINQNQRGVLEKMVDYLVGDGPNSRFAMICKDCLMHNGMALQEDYEYTAFRCAFCASLNPAKKQRPLAPRLPFEQAQLDKMSEVRRSTSSIAESESSSPEDNGAVVEGSEQEDDTEIVQENDDVKEKPAIENTDNEETASAPAETTVSNVEEEQHITSNATDEVTQSEIKAD